MIFVPSPQALLHGNHPNYKKSNSNICAILENQNLTEQQYLDFGTILIDFNLLNSSNSKNPSLLSYFKSLIAIIASLDYEKNMDHSLYHFFFGLLSLQCGDKENAIYFLKYVAGKGNIDAINLLSKILFFFKDFYKIENSTEIAKNVLMNAYRQHSIDSLFQLGNIYKSPNYILSLYFFYEHFRKTDSNISVLQICKLLRDHMNDINLTKKWILFSLSRGEPKFIKAVINENSDQDNQIQTSEIWKRAISNLSEKILISYQINSSDKSKADANSNFYSDVYVNSKFDLSADPNIFYISNPISYKLFEMTPNLYQYQSSIETNQFFPIHSNSISQENNIIPSFPSKNKTKLILSIFELTSSNFKKRNLKIASLFLSELYKYHSDGVLSSELFKLRRDSSNHEWISCCGFIYLLLNEIDLALNMFLKSSNLGNYCATMMCGFLLFHWKNDQEQMKKKACFFFSKCSADPIALIHLFFIFDDVSLLDRACSILGIESRIKCIFWLVNLLIDGTKMPCLPNCPAKIICAAAIDFGIRNDEDTTDLYNYYLHNFQ